MNAVHAVIQIKQAQRYRELTSVKTYMQYNEGPDRGSETASVLTARMLWRANVSGSCCFQ